MPAEFIYLATGILVVVLVGWLISRAINSGKKLPTPTTRPYDDQDAPPADSKSRTGS
jgi:hypothetical protein